MAAGTGALLPYHPSLPTKQTLTPLPLADSFLGRCVPFIRFRFSPLAHGLRLGPCPPYFYRFYFFRVGCAREEGMG